MPIQLKNSGRSCQVPLSNLVDILIEEQNSQRPPQRKCPMSGNACFHFLLPSMNSTRGNGLGLDPIHTEANQKHLFLEINLSSGNELYIHRGGGAGGTYVHVLSHAFILCITDKIHGQIPRQAGLSFWEGKTIRWLASKDIERKVV